MVGFERAMSLLHMFLAGAHLAFAVAAAVGGFLLLNWLG
jgi:hypothetical protein